MVRVKRGMTKHRRHKKVLTATSGHRTVRHKHYKRAKESLIHALTYAYRHRRERKGDFRRLWIIRVGAAARIHGMNYSQFTYGLRLAGIGLNRKMLADLAVRDPQAFEAIVEQAKAAIPQPAK